MGEEHKGDEERPVPPPEVSSVPLAPYEQDQLQLLSDFLERCKRDSEFGNVFTFKTYCANTETLEKTDYLIDAALAFVKHALERAGRDDDQSGACGEALINLALRKGTSLRVIAGVSSDLCDMMLCPKPSKTPRFAEKFLSVFISFCRYAEGRQHLMTLKSKLAAIVDKYRLSQETFVRGMELVIKLSCCSEYRQQFAHGTTMILLFRNALSRDTGLDVKFTGIKMLSVFAIEPTVKPKLLYFPSFINVCMKTHASNEDLVYHCIRFFVSIAGTESTSKAALCAVQPLVAVLKQPTTTARCAIMAGACFVNMVVNVPDIPEASSVISALLIAVRRHLFDPTLSEYFASVLLVLVPKPKVVTAYSSWLPPLLLEVLGRNRRNWRVGAKFAKLCAQLVTKLGATEPYDPVFELLMEMEGTLAASVEGVDSLAPELKSVKELEADEKEEEAKTKFTRALDEFERARDSLKVVELDEAGDALTDTEEDN